MTTTTMLLSQQPPFVPEGGDVIHYQAASNLADRWSRFVAVRA